VLPNFSEPFQSRRKEIVFCRVLFFRLFPSPFLIAANVQILIFVSFLLFRDAAAPTTTVQEPQEAMDYLKALKAVLKKALKHDGLARGLRESVKALDRKDAHLCVLAESCNEPAYKRLVEALCHEHKVNLLTVEDGKELGVWAGLGKFDKEGNSKPKHPGASVVVVRDFGEPSAELDFLLEHIKKSKQ
jgi:small subunit ribosomal protein S12e